MKRERIFLKFLLVGLCVAMLAACSSSKEDKGNGNSGSGISIPDKEGMTVKGIVKDTSGKGIADVVVSDGLEVTSTDENGIYYLPSDLARRRFVFISLPATHEVPATQGCPRFYRRIDASERVNRADFTLTPRKAAGDDYTFIVLADVQIKRGNNSIESYIDHVVPDVLETTRGIGGQIYGMSLGDLVFNQMDLFPQYRKGLEALGFTTFNLPGNHDHDPAQLTDSLALRNYEQYFGPANYSFNLGQIHYVFMDNILFDHKATDEDEYVCGLTDEICDWLERDLSHVAHGSTLVVATHCPILDLTNNSSARYLRNFDRFCRLVEPYDLYAFGGHKHYNDCYVYADGTVMYCVARTTGELYINGDTGCDGTPRGYLVLDVAGRELSWYYKSADKPRDYQMRVYSPKRTNSDYVLANIWGYDVRWGEVEWIEADGTKKTMTRTRHTDPQLEDIIASGGIGGAPTNSWHMFRIEPSSCAKGGTVRVTDRFGATYETAVAW